MCEKPEVPENVDITEGQEPEDESIKLTEELLDNFMPKNNSGSGEPTPPENETLTKGE